MKRSLFLLSIFTILAAQFTTPGFAQSYGDAFCGGVEQCALRYAYVEDVEKRIRNHWRPAFSTGNNPVVIDFQIRRDGTASRITLKQSSLDRNNDLLGLEAIKKASPFKPIPAEMNQTEKMRFELYPGIHQSPVTSRSLSDTGVDVRCVITIPSSQSTADDTKNLISYAEYLEKRIKTTWNPGSSSSSSGNSEFTFILHKGGKISDLELATASKDEGFDQSAREAIKNCAPFDPLPQNGPEAAIVSLHFKQAPPLMPAKVEQKKTVLAAQVDVDYGPYMANLQRKIRSNWAGHNDQVARRTVLIFRIHANGDISRISLIESSGNESIDQAAISAVSKSSPLDPMPTGCLPDVDIQYTFDTIPPKRKVPMMKARLYADSVAITSTKSELRQGLSCF